MKDQGRANSAFDRADFIVTTAVKWVSYLGAAALFIIAVLSTVNVAATKLFGMPISNATEFVTYMNIPIVFFCIGFVQLNTGHTHINLIYNLFPKAVHTFIHLLGYVLGVIVCGYAGWCGIQLTLQKAASMAFASGPNSFLIWPFVSCIGIGYLVLSLSFLWCIPRELLGKGPYTLSDEGPDEKGGETP